MPNRYRLTYLAIIATLMSGAVFVAAEAAPGRDGASSVAVFATLVDKVKGGTEKEPDRPEPGTKEMVTEGDYLAALVMSKSQPVLIFKHSTQCEVSGAAYRRTAKWLTESEDEKPRVFLVKVIEHRPVSQLIEKQTEVKHESPQVILLSEGEPVWNTSHEAITEDSLSKALAELHAPESSDEPSDPS